MGSFSRKLLAVQRFHDKQRMHVSQAFHCTLTIPEDPGPSGDKNLTQKKLDQHLDMHPLLQNSARVIIIDNPAKFKLATEWQKSVIKCMWPPPEFEGEYQWESADEVEDSGEYGSTPHNRNVQRKNVPVLRILCRLLIEAATKYRLSKSGVDVREAVKEIQKQMDHVIKMVCLL
jgi:hypothetical protein